MLISQGETYLQVRNKETIDVRENVISQRHFTIKVSASFQMLLVTNLEESFY